MPQAVKRNLFLYADGSCLVIQGNEDFTNICEWFVDNRLSIHFGEDKTRCILFASKRNIKRVPKLKNKYKIYKYDNIQRSHAWVVY